MGIEIDQYIKRPGGIKTDQWQEMGLVEWHTDKNLLKVNKRVKQFVRIFNNDIPNTN